MNWIMITTKNIPLQGTVVDIKYQYKDQSFNYTGIMSTYKNSWTKDNKIGIKVFNIYKEKGRYLRWYSLSNHSDFSNCFWKIADKNKYMAFL